MATKLYLRSPASVRDYGASNNDANMRGTAIGWNPLNLATTAGSATTATPNVATVAGATAGVEVGSATVPLVWYSPPLAAAATISGSITWNIWAAESSASANVAINGRIEKVDGTTGAITVIDTTARTTELALTTAGLNNFAKTPAAGVACKKGDRLRVRIFGDDAGTMATGFTFFVDYSGATASADGDTWLQLTETLTFVSEPAGTTVYPTDTASAVSTASVDREAWTSRGAGVQTDVITTIAGWTAPIQVTDTAGGTVVDWFTRPLTAFTLGGAARVNVRGAEGAARPNTTLRCEVARVAGDGTSPTVWALGGNGSELGASEGAASYLISGDDLAISSGQRLRVRFYVDDQNSAAMLAASTATLYYAGTSGGASGDTFLTFTQTLTEASVPVTGTGAGTGTASTSDGTAAETFVGTGGGTGTAASATGSGDVSAAGATGTGAGTQAAATALGTGVETISGSGAGSPPPATSAGTGSSLLAVTGTGAGEQAAASATGEALQVFPGGGVQVPQSAYGEGTVEGGVEVPPTVEGSTIFAPKLRVIAGSGGGVQVRQSAKGRGTVNDDELVVMAA